MIVRRLIPLFTSEKGLVLTDQVVVSGSAFATNLLLAQALGPVAYGRYSAVVLAQLFLLSLQQAAGSGLYQVVWPSLPEADKKPYTDGLLYAQLGWLVGLLALAGLANGLWSGGLPGFGPAELGAAVVATGLYLLQDFVRKTLLAQQRAGQALWLDALTNAGQLAGLVWFRVQGGLSLSVALWLVGLTFLPSVGLGIWWLRPARPHSADLARVGQEHRQQGGWMLLSALTQWLAGNFLLVAGGWWLGAAALGALRLAQYVFGLLNVGLQALESYVAPRAAQLAHQPAQLVGYLGAILRKSGLAMVPVLVGLVLGAEPLLVLAGGADYQPFAYVVYGLALVYVLVVLGYPIRILLRVRQLAKHYFIGYALATALNLASASWLIREHGLKGVLAGLFLTQAVLIGYWLLVLHHSGLFTWKSFTLFSAKPIRPE
ncbi:oligosaccharide flippase family protein [Rudanella paleaurantiibacter]|uniref:Oligosaccharide flippase family protein n=1 Tax=Rudanella paleaurantiibacter TaxID=2614655 RepID=A0A7J5TUH6_9BACT|nr:oligosaccharide flippase family protein [Rudanella paleaurantiibacter]KAB7727660.1 oligosaccharide flippase family protein [Rudanella paleaurantiibacter]